MIQSITIGATDFNSALPGQKHKQLKNYMKKRFSLFYVWLCFYLTFLVETQFFCDD